MVVRQKPVKPRSQFSQKPQPTLNGMHTRSPFLIRCADLDNFAKVFVTKDPALLEAGTALVHVKVRPANVGGGHPNDHIGRFLDLGIVDGIDRNIFGPVVHDSFHGSFPFADLPNASSNRELGDDPVHRNGGGHRTLRSDLSFLNLLLPERFLPVGTILGSIHVGF